MSPLQGSFSSDGFINYVELARGRVTVMVLWLVIPLRIQLRGIVCELLARLSQKSVFVGFWCGPRSDGTRLRRSSHSLDAIKNLARSNKKSTCEQV